MEHCGVDELYDYPIRIVVLVRSKQLMKYISNVIRAHRVQHHLHLCPLSLFVLFCLSVAEYLQSRKIIREGHNVQPTPWPQFVPKASYRNFHVCPKTIRQIRGAAGREWNRGLSYQGSWRGAHFWIREVLR
jgi:hypothetical protein